MTDQLDSRAAGMVMTVSDDNEHPIHQAIVTPADGVPFVDQAEPEGAEAADEPTASEIDAAASSAAEAAAHEGDDLDDTASITIPSAEILADPAAVAELVAAHAETPEIDEGYPIPPERGSLDDDDLVPLVGRHTDDTATIDLIGILQAQMQLRSTEAQRFADWEERMRQIGTAEALGEVERTRLHFTGVIPVQTPRPVVTVENSAPAQTAKTSAAEPYVVVHEAPSVPVIGAGTAPTTDGFAVAEGAQHERTPDEEVLEHDEPLRQTASEPADGATLSRTATPRILVAILSIVAALVVIASFLATALGSSVGIAAAVSALGVLAAAWLGIVLAKLALRPRGSRSLAPVTARSAWALVAGLVVGTAVGEGLIRTTSTAFAWQGYLLRLVDVEGVHAELSVAAGVIAALVIAFVLVVLIDRGPVEPTAKAEPTTK